ncbi:Ger(x)C family spore germination protein [Paenibacillus sp. DMB20]|uniref:Ger(x)C family spore germination protein n=1 Tax=Paenibacillus sp. DMB20 TaxID=1642570 RepID=UPI000627A86B|nr:Ger(x)C family spore germination protein [Paenibacillus sp. DMB20]KKO53658.1 hypothetical protein XI25_11730 [Paenibacillus sp. DMB20]
MKLLNLWKTLLPLLLLTGCWSKVEINEQAFIFALYFDKGEQEGTVEVTISSPLPNRLISGQQVGSGGNEGPPYGTVSKTGHSIAEALNAIQRDLSRRLDFSHNRVIVIGKEFAEEGIGDLLDWILRERSIDLSTFMMQAPGEAKEIAGLAPVYESFPSYVLKRLAIQNNMLATTVKDCLIGQLGNTGYALTHLSSEEMPLTGDKMSMGKWTGLQGIALFQKDKYKGALDLESSRVLAWASGQIHKPVYNVAWDGGKSKASVLFFNTKGYKEAVMTASGPVFTVKLDGTADIVSMKDEKKRSLAEVNRIIVSELNDQIGTYLKEALKTTQEKGADVMQLGNMLEAEYPRAWSELSYDWEEKYRTEADFNIKLNLHIRNPEAASSAP